MEGSDPASLEWRKSSASGTGTGDCVEVAATDSGVRVRNSRFRSGPVLEFTWAEWRAFLEGIARGEFPVPASEG